jgi:hypothetical protein
VGVAGLAAGIITGEMAISDKSSSDSNCPHFLNSSGELRCTQTGVNNMNNASTMALLSDIGFGIGAVGIVSGTVMMVLKTRREATVQQAAPSLPAPSAWSDPSSWFWNVAPSPRGTQAVLGHSF